MYGGDPLQISLIKSIVVRTSSSLLPPSLTTLTLCDNQLDSLTDVSQLASLSRLDHLTLSDNPCVDQPEELDKQFDYRPYVINWCLGLRMLDGVPVGAKESLKVRTGKLSSQYKSSQLAAF